MASKKMTAKLYKGMPQIELLEDDTMAVHLPLCLKMRDEIMEKVAKGPITISFESLEVDLQNNQSFGMMACSTGCASNPGGPSC